MIQTKPFALATLALALAMSPLARADEFVEQSIPGRWITPLLPEDLPALEYPAYYKELDKARLEAFTGRYKKSLLTLRKAKDADPLAAALIRGNSLWAIGKADDALKALSDPKVVDAPEAQVLRARIIANQGKLAGAVALLKKIAAQHKEAANKHAVAAHYFLGQFLELTGDMDGARQAYD